MNIPPAETVYPRILEANSAIQERARTANEKIELFFRIVVLPEFRRLISNEIENKLMPSLDGKTSPFSSQSFDLFTPPILPTFGSYMNFSELQELFPYSDYSRIKISPLAIFFEDYPIYKLMAPLVEELTNLGYKNIFIDFSSETLSSGKLNFDELSFRIRFAAKLSHNPRKG